MNHGGDNWRVSLLHLNPVQPDGHPLMSIDVGDWSLLLGPAVIKGETVTVEHVEFAKALHELAGEYLFELDRLVYVDGAATAV